MISEANTIGTLILRSAKAVEANIPILDTTTIPIRKGQQLGGSFLEDVQECPDLLELHEPQVADSLEPLEVLIEGDYLSGSFQDTGYAMPPYRIMIWLLVEEKPVEILKPVL
ncbi:MAG: hypothetical protein WBA74_07390 [Cyclobacteriaceae bacterium]